MFFWDDCGRPLVAQTSRSKHRPHPVRDVLRDRNNPATSEINYLVGLSCFDDPDFRVGVHIRVHRQGEGRLGWAHALPACHLKRPRASWRDRPATRKVVGQPRLWPYLHAIPPAAYRGSSPASRSCPTACRLSPRGHQGPLNEAGCRNKRVMTTSSNGVVDSAPNELQSV
jgi:hypothetical protein